MKLIVPALVGAAVLAAGAGSASGAGTACPTSNGPNELVLAGGSGQNACYSQGAVAQLDSEACFASNGQQYEFCAHPNVTKYACAGGLPPGVTSVPDCTTAIGVANYSVGTSSVATINPETNQITAQLPGTTAITASLAGSGSSAGYFSTCSPKSISVALSICAVSK